MSSVKDIIKEYPDVWKTESSFWSFVKGIIRSGWNTHPAKILLIKSKRKMIPNPNPRGVKKEVWGCTCEICGKTDVLKNFQVDHVTDETAKLTKQEDIQTCVEKLLMVTSKDLRMLCIHCHSIVSLSQKKGISFEEAAIEKQVIAFRKLPSKQQIELLLTFGKEYGNISPASKRIEKYREIISVVK